MCHDKEIFLFHNNGNPAPAPPKNFGYTGAAYQHPIIAWAPNSERDIASYKLYRRYEWVPDFSLYATLSAGTTSFTDPEVQLAPPGGHHHWTYYYVTAQDNAGNSSDPSNTISVSSTNQTSKVATSAVPAQFVLHQNYPNPFNPSTQIDFDLPEDSFVSLNVFDVLGRKVGEIANGNYAAGYHSATWNAAGVASGVYFARFTATDEFGKLKFSKIGKLILSK